MRGVTVYAYALIRTPHADSTDVPTCPNRKRVPGQSTWSDGIEHFSMTVGRIERDWAEWQVYQQIGTRAGQ
jgi:hypothetical protein